MRATRVRTGLVVAGLAAVAAGSATGGSETRFLTSQPSMLKAGDRADVTFTPIVTVGDTLQDGYRFESIPDGIALRRSGGKRVEVFVNHETSKVPFPYNTATPTAANGENDFDNAQVSRLVLDRSGAVLSAELIVRSSSGWQRFCSNTLATRQVGFKRDLLLTNEESPDWVRRETASWPPVPGEAAEREAGVAVAVDPKTGTQTPIYGMGRHNHENSVPVPGYGKPVVLSGDDTFTSGSLTSTLGIQAAQSQLYSYIAKDSEALLKDRGELYAFVSDTPGFDDYYDFAPGSTASISGHFVKVPKEIATGRKADGSELKAADVGYPLPPTDGSWQTDLRLVTPTGIDGPQWVLQHWSDLNDVFEFVRVEDLAYDRNPGMGNVVYIADSGRGRAGAPAQGLSTNGRIWKMVLDKADPTRVTSLSILVEGDDNTVKTPGEIHQPDNLETTRSSLLVLEDPGSSQQFAPTDPDARSTSARVWRVPLANPAGAEIVARIDQSADGGPTDVDGRAKGNFGAWESSGVVDASAVFGPGAFLIDVQAHTLWVEQAPGDDNNGDGQADFTYKREGGQLILMRIPGA